MGNIIRKTIIASVTLLLTTVSTFAVETFYVTSNKADENTVVVYQHDKSGSFAKIGEYPTGGKGTGDLEIPALKKDSTHPLANGDDPLISANAIDATYDRKYLVTVNPGNGTISLLSISKSFELKSINQVEASDKFPVSVAIYNDNVAVASVGNDNSNGSIATYKIVNGKLESIVDSRRDLQARPSTIRFSSDGEHVIVDELVTGKIKVFAMDGDNLSSEPVSMIDSPRGSDDRFQAIPVGFVVRGDGGDDVLLVSEARFLTPDYTLRRGNNEVTQSPLYSWQTGSISTYKLTDDGQISLASADVLTGKNVEGGEIANCWVALSNDGKTLYAANALSSSISSFNIGDDGTAELSNQAAFKDKSEELFFSDMAVSEDGNQLIQLVGNKGQVMIFDISANGELTHNQTVDGLPELGSYGLLVH